MYLNAGGKSVHQPPCISDHARADYFHSLFFCNPMQEELKDVEDFLSQLLTKF